MADDLASDALDGWEYEKHDDELYIWDRGENRLVLALVESDDVTNMWVISQKVRDDDANDGYRTKESSSYIIDIYGYDGAKREAFKKAKLLAQEIKEHDL